MKSETWPLAMPKALLKEIRAAAKETDLSISDAMRQSMKLGVPKLRARFGTGRVTNVDPMPARQAKKLYSQPDDDTEDIKFFMSAQSRTTE
jgi:hypothetical protein